MEPTSPAALPDPVLLSPVREQRVAVDDLVLRWEPVPGADGYTVEVAADTAFEEVLARATAGRATELALGVLDPGQTYFWRVLATRGDASSRGERVESFLVQTYDDLRDQAHAGVVSVVDAKEDLGPAAELAKSAGTSAAREAAGVQGFESSADPVHEGAEPESVESAQILSITLAVLAAIVVIFVVLTQWNGLVADRARLTASSTALNPNPDVARYPVLAEADRNAASALDSYEVLDVGTGTYRIPIQRAIDLMANRAQGGADSVRVAVDTTASSVVNLTRY